MCLEEQERFVAFVDGNLFEAIGDRIRDRFNKPRMVKESTQLVDLGALGPTNACARMMSSRYCRQPE
jgi:hypothetical protein